MLLQRSLFMAEVLREAMCFHMPCIVLLLLLFHIAHTISHGFNVFVACIFIGNE